jgi:hypothetical protein
MRVLVLFGCLMLAVPQARAVDGMSFELGTDASSNASVDMGRIGLQWDWAKRWAVGSDWHLGGYWDLGLGYWSNDSADRTHKSISEIGFTPVFRLQQTAPGALAPYLEAGIGAHVLSHTSVSPGRRFSTMFQFGEHVGLGLRFVMRNANDIGYRFQHLSNADIKKPNQGINFHQIRFQYHF